MSTKTKIFSWAYEFWKFPWQIQKKDTKKQQKKKAFISFSVKNTQLIFLGFLFWFLFFLTRKTSAEKNWMETDKSEFLKKQNEQMLQKSKFESNQDMFEFVLGKESPHWRLARNNDGSPFVECFFLVEFCSILTQFFLCVQKTDTLV